ncbi:MAG TPA: antibiotic biosynthesis monooxygenase [Bacteroidales bacterium]|nr:antibiotic biosynthesis monooxygenase [Bacteroidales bacterium]
MALQLKAELSTIDGFISIERFTSLQDSKKILSLSFWQNAESIKRWRTLECHRMAQEKGRDYIFKDYHLRVAYVVRDYGMADRKQASEDSRLQHDNR